MAKVGKEQLRHKSSHNCIEIEIHVDSKTKRFFQKGFPEEIAQWYAQQDGGEGTGDYSTDTYEKLKSLYSKIYSDYHDQTVKEKKVILYQLAYCNSTNGNNTGSFMGMVAGDALQMHYIIRWRIDIGTAGFYSTANYEQSKQPEHGVRLGGPKLEGVKSHNYSKYRELDYSEELEAFFSDTTNKFRKLIEGISNFFGESPEKLLESISTQKVIGNGN